ncbi:MAG: prephenate dehydratase [Gammaproteobacteria bacterium]|nr:prephenate dehydratase [Gammaproteobacteria bacterium]
MSSNQNGLDEIRARIDEIDARLVELLSRRAAMVAEVAGIKRAGGDHGNFHRPDREAQILRRVQELNPGPLSGEEMARLFREIISACFALEQSIEIAYLGPEGTFTHDAALKHFGGSVTVTACPGIDQVFRQVEAGRCHFGVVPVENSMEGAVDHTLDMLMNSPLRICGEVELRIHQHLMSRAPEPGAIRRVYSHQQSLAQCRAWLNGNLPGAERIPVSSNSEAARMAAGDSGAAAVAGAAAAQVHGVPIMIRNIEDSPDNTTRFLVLGRDAVGRTGRDKTSVLFTTQNRPGALFAMLKCFADKGVSLTRIESRPSRRGMWDYVFFADLEGHADDAPVAAALSALQREAAMVRVLGSYPGADL